jgi:hypothetical protein
VLVVGGEEALPPDPFDVVEFFGVGVRGGIELESLFDW